jgi:lipoprotein NlpD
MILGDRSTPVSMRSLFRPVLQSGFRWILAAGVLAIAGCATHRPAPIEDRALGRGEPPRIAASGRAEPSIAAAEPPPAATYTVKRGDTLHQIALDNGLDYRELAGWNNIENVNRIFP